MSFELSATNLTDTSVSLVMTLTSDYESDATISFSFQQGGSSGQTVYATSAIIPSGSHTGDNITTNVDNQLTASTTYYVAATSGGALLDDVTITTKATGYNDPRTATQEQWEDLATKVKAKADASSIPTVNNSTITVTNNGLDKGTFTTNQATAGTVALDYPTITMTTTDPGEGAALAANNYVAVYGGDPIILDYSTSEINTGAKWIDGSAIYKKTVNFGALPNNTTKTVAHGISGLAKVIKMEGYTKNSNNVFQMLPYVPTNSAYLTNVHTDLTNIEMQSIGDLSGYTECYVTLYYTKSS